MATHLGLLRSLIVYWRPGRQRALRRLYAPFLAPGDLAFDIGAHLGDRAMAWAGLGASVVACEPQPDVLTWLRRIAGTHESITIRAEAVGRRKGTATLALSRSTPTVSTLAAGWAARVARENPTFAKVRWEDSVQVSVTTLDALIETYGPPRFCKIDVEGGEADVLRGLTVPIPGLSIEFVSGGLEVAVECVDRLDQLGPYRFNAVLGEGRRFVFGDEWQGADEIRAWLNDGASGASSGDLYARLSERKGAGVPDVPQETGRPK